MTKITSDAKVSKISVADERDLGAFIPSLLDDYGLNVYEFRIYCRLARRSGSGSCWESINNMAAACRINRKTVMQAIASLINYCMVRQEKRPGKSDLYKLTASSFWKKQPVLPTDCTSPSSGHPSDEPVPVTDTTSPCDGHRQSVGGTAPVLVADIKVLPQGFPVSFSQELTGEEEVLPPAIAPLGGASPATLINEEEMPRDAEVPQIKLTDDELKSHLDAALRGVMPSDDVIAQLRDSDYWVCFRRAAEVHNWDLGQLSQSEVPAHLKEQMRSLKEKFKRRRF